MPQYFFFLLKSSLILVCSDCLSWYLTFRVNFQYDSGNTLVSSDRGSIGLSVLQSCYCWMIKALLFCCSCIWRSDTLSAWASVTCWNPTEGEISQFACCIAMTNSGRHKKDHVKLYMCIYFMCCVSDCVIVLLWKYKHKEQHCLKMNNSGDEYFYCLFQFVMVLMILQDVSCGI